MEKNMQSIKYNGKTIKLPCDILNNDIEIVTETNPYSNQSCELPKFARGVYYAKVYYMVSKTFYKPILYTIRLTIKPR